MHREGCLGQLKLDGVMENKKKKEPAHIIPMGRIKAKIWENRDKKTGSAWFNTEIVRLYKEDEEWQESTQFGVNDLPLIAKAADFAFQWILGQKDEKDQSREDDE